MATAYPGALDTSTQQPSPSATTDLDASGYEHATVHTNHSGALIALETKLGLTDSNASSGAILVGTGASTTAWTTSPSINTTGSAATLTTARAIAGVNFDGSAAIDLGDNANLVLSGQIYS